MKASSSSVPEHHLRLAIALLAIVLILIIAAILGISWQQQGQPNNIVAVPVSNNGKVVLTATQSQAKALVISDTNTAQTKLSPADAKRKAALIESQKH